MIFFRPKSRFDFLRLYFCLAFIFLGWAVFSRFSQASTELSWLYPAKTALRGIFHADALTNLEHIASAAGFLCLSLVLNWFVLGGDFNDRRNSRLVICATLFVVIGGYFVHQFIYEFLDPRNQVNQFHWDLLGLVIGWLLIWPSLRSK